MKDKKLKAWKPKLTPDELSLIEQRRREIEPQIQANVRGDIYDRVVDYIVAKLKKCWDGVLWVCCGGWMLIKRG